MALCSKTGHIDAVYLRFVCIKTNYLDTYCLDFLCHLVKGGGVSY